ncbi:MAG TPA: hypothetical protein DD473_24560 [Planctomycetaceae bacterium]|nr:hypothetical protein [Planctomycetaceae bacterium]
MLVRVDKLRYRGTVPERLSQMINIGQPVELEIESISDPQSTRVTRISPLLDQMSRALMFEAVVENPDRNLRAGLFAEASVIVDPNAQAVVIPIDAVVQFAGSEKVWKVVDGKVSEQIVLLGDRREGLVRILQGLQPGDVILGNAKGGQAGILADAKAEKKAKEDKSS